MTNFFQLADLGLSTDVSSLVQLFQGYLQDNYPGYVPQPANLEYLMAAMFATWAADAANLCSSGGTELFIQYGTQLFNLPMETGSSAAAVIQVNAVDDAGYTLSSGAQFLLDSTAGFQTFQPYVIPPGSTTIQVTIAANTPGTLANGLGNVSVVSNQALSWLLSTTLVTQSSGGVDPETSDQYVQRLAETIQLAAPRPVTAGDFGTMSLSFTPQPGSDQQEVGRATAIDGYNPTQTSFTGTLHGTTSVTSVGANVGISINSIISGAFVPLGTTVVAINGSSASTAQASAGSNTLTLSQSASGSATETLVSTGTYFNERTVTVCVTDSNGLPLNNDTMYGIGGASAMVISDPNLWGVDGWLESMREVNFIVNVVPPTYNYVWVEVSVFRNTLYDAVTVQSNIQTTLINLFSPSSWGVQSDSSGSVWFNVPKIYQSVIESAIQQTTGVDHISTGTLVGGISLSDGIVPTFSAFTDVQLVGPFSLTISDTTTIPLSAITVLN